jgi:restriction endonuclease Mrr
VSISVVFQCKRYQAKLTVKASEISEFRGSIPNSIDKGIFITSSDFTAQARSAARASDKKPIELISGSDIVRLMEKCGLGLRRVYDIDRRFFDDFEFEG